MINTNRKTRVLLLIKGLGVGGAEKLLVSSIPYLNTKDFEYQVAYFLSGKTTLVPEFEKAGIPVTCLNIENAFGPRAFLKVRRFFKEQGFDIVHVHSPHCGILGRPAAQFSPVKAVVYTEHMPIERQSYLAQIGNIMTYPLNDATVAVSEAVLHSVLHRQFIKHGTFCTIHNGVDLNKFKSSPARRSNAREALGIPENCQVVGNVANLLPGKAHSDLLRAAALVLEKLPLTKFVIVGKESRPEDLICLKALVQSLGIQDSVLFTGFREDVLDVMDTFDIFVLPSLWEGLGIVFLEAMALEKPVIGTNVGGIPEVIENGRNGFLVEPRHPAELAKKILVLLQDNELRINMGHNGFTRVIENFDIRNTVSKTEAIYRTLMDAGYLTAGGTDDIRHVAVTHV